MYRNCSKVVHRRISDTMQCGRHFRQNVDGRGTRVPAIADPVELPHSCPMSPGTLWHLDLWKTCQENRAQVPSRGFRSFGPILRTDMHDPLIFRILYAIMAVGKTVSVAQRLKCGFGDHILILLDHILGAGWLSCPFGPSTRRSTNTL